MTGKISIALIGAGGIGKRWAHAISLVPAVKLVAVIDVDLVKAKTIADQFKNCAARSDWKEILNDKKIRAVVIATPHKFLSPISQAMLRAKKNVLVEKPAATSSKQLKKTISVAVANKVNFMVGFNHRFHPAFLLARKFVNQNKIGKIQFIRSVYAFGGRPGFEKEWRHKRELSGGGELVDQGIHMIDMVRSFLGDCGQAKGFVGSLFWNTRVEDNAFVLLKNSKKQIASIHVSWSNWKPIHSFEIYGTTGYLKIEGLGRKYGGTEKLFLGRRNEETPDHPKEQEFVCDPDADKSLCRELNEFILSIKKNREPLVTGRDALAALKIVEEIYKQN